MQHIKTTLVLVLLLIICAVAGCGGCGGEENPEENSPGAPAVPPEVEYMESSLLEIMRQADLIPFIEESAQEEQEEGQSSEPTFEETTLGEVLGREMEEGGAGGGEEEVPGSPEEAWNSMKTLVIELHEQWNELEPALAQEGVDQTVINSFEENLDSLTATITGQKHFATMDTANQLTWHLAVFMLSFKERAEALPNELRYHVRNIVLSSAAGDFAEARESMAYIAEKTPAVTKDMEDEQSGQFEAAVENLERALEKEDMNLIRLNAAQLMENLQT